MLECSIIDKAYLYIGVKMSLNDQLLPGAGGWRRREGSIGIDRNVLTLNCGNVFTALYV